MVVVVGPIGFRGVVAFGKKSRLGRKRADARRGLVSDKIN